MRRIGFAVRLALVLVLMIPVAMVSSGSTLAAQEMELAVRGPRFLVASPSSRAAPVEIDAGSNALLRRIVSLRLDQPTVGRVLDAIERQTGIRIFFNPARVVTDRGVTLRAESITVAAALTEVLLGTGLDVLISQRNQVALVERANGVAAPPAGSIVGRVTEAKTQTAMAGATVVVEGTRHSATTGTDGRYRIADMAPGTYTVRARYIGYAPGTVSVTVSTDEEATADLALEKSAQWLDEVVTTGTMIPTEVKALPTPISVVTADDIQRDNLQRVDQAFRGQIPGAMAWDFGPDDYYSSIAVRGGSTLTDIPHIKTFIDGVEVADPQYVAMIDPNSVDRIEITRGPQASTLYGAGALDGVMQIFTKKGQLGLARPEVMGKLSAGGIGGVFGQSTALQTDNAISILGGGEKTSYNVGGSYRHTGEWAPNYRSSDWGLSTGGQTVQGPFTLSGSARYADKTFDQKLDTRFSSYTPYSRPWFEPNRYRQQTYGVMASLQATRNWQHTVTIGYDQTYWSFDQTQPRFTTPADSFLQAYTQHQAKASLLYHTDLSVRRGAVGTTVTVGVNYDAYDYASSYTGGATHTTGNLDGSSSATLNSWTNTGYFTQVQVDLADRFFLTGGLRAERNTNFGADFGTAWSPRFGAAYVLGHGSATVKLRGSYGDGIRAPFPGARDAQQFPGCCQYLANPGLAPERQRGADGGVEVYLGNASLGVTYYNQRAIDLINLTTIPTAPGTLRSYQYRNISRVKNEGWEFEAHLPLGRLQLAGTYTITNSTVQELPPDYPTGNLQVGDHILGVPHTSAGATVTYSPLPTTTVSASMTHFGHWTDYDWVSLFGYYFGGQPYRGSFRAYWIEYPTVTKFAVSIGQVVTKSVTAFVRAENVGNNLRYEQNNENVPMPRRVIVGANFKF